MCKTTLPFSGGAAAGRPPLSVWLRGPRRLQRLAKPVPTQLQAPARHVECEASAIDEINHEVVLRRDAGDRSPCEVGHRALQTLEPREQFPDRDDAHLLPPPHEEEQGIMFANLQRKEIEAVRTYHEVFSVVRQENPPSPAR
jgi:hypothetical protein